MTNDIFEQILKDHKELSSLPQTLAEVLKIVKDENASTRDLADVLVKDPALTAKLLRIVNSPYYGAGREITTVTQAAMTLGTRAISALALSSSIYDLSGQWQVSVDRQRFWRHSLEVAMAARMIARESGYAYPEEAFICGLLHDIGILILEKSFPDKFQRIWKQAEAGESISELEEHIWGTNHARIGQFLLEQWGLPAVICEAVGHHHSQILTESTDPELRPAQIVSLANLVSRFTIAKVRPELAENAESMSTLSAALELAPPRLVQLQEDLLSAFIEEAKFLEIEIGSPEELLIEANRIIYSHYLSVENLLSENRRMQQEVARAQMEKATLEALKTITATFNHYINNASATILGRAQLIELKIKSDEIGDPNGEAAGAMSTIVEGVNTITSVIAELQELTKFKTTVYHDDTYIIDLEGRLKKQLDHLQRGHSAAAVAKPPPQST
ncbi:MAG: HDOD domain-containing protein [candidate division Zixibacteria bacterium]|nr:HDOD domain-containing protein [candidate division Zixibacteria bacterium]MDH3938219.1 HDOD domain-containing protein [candidate division Zixibacteria bacterium]MDH4032917.1 HDOD domain-containing protein [candidate division Zixibacteria bacterium]